MESPNEVENPGRRRALQLLYWGALFYGAYRLGLIGGFGNPEKNLPQVPEKPDWPEFLDSQNIQNVLDLANKYELCTSIVLAQIVLEATVREEKNTKRVLSDLARNYNNYFGHKCGNIECPHKEDGSVIAGPCITKADDRPDDKFRHYESFEACLYAHGEWLHPEKVTPQNQARASRYAPLQKIPRQDYKTWARGLKASGYATDPLYAEKLIEIVEYYGLNRYD